MQPHAGAPTGTCRKMQTCSLPCKHHKGNNMHKMSQLKSRQLGYNLMELMIVVVIVAIISSIAYPSYTQYVVNTKRTTAASALLRVADRQQQFFMDNKSYSNDLTNLGFAADPLILTGEGAPVAAGDPNAVYTISVRTPSATTFLATAEPLHGQLARDTKCGKLTLDQALTKGSGNSKIDCW